MPMRIAVIGAGSWGTTVAHLCAKNVPTTLWARRDDIATEVRDTHVNTTYLSGYTLTPSLHATASLSEAVSGADVLVMGVPSHGMRQAARDLAGFLRPWVPVVSLAKGLEEGSRLRMTQVLAEELPGHPCGVLTGPNLAKEILGGDAAASVIAMEDPVIAQSLQGVFASDLFRVYTNPDVVGCELAGALKNVMAIASGMADGLGTGDNTRSAVITRGLSELTRLGCAMGGQQATFAGLAGMGDLVLTCTGDLSRNRQVGLKLGHGKTLQQILAEMEMVAEGIKTTRSAMALAKKIGVEMPILEQVYAMIYEDKPCAEAVQSLLGRDSKEEMAEV